jgi:hypothetical protein
MNVAIAADGIPKSTAPLTAMRGALIKQPRLKGEHQAPSAAEVEAAAEHAAIVPMVSQSVRRPKVATLRLYD